MQPRSPRRCARRGIALLIVLVVLVLVATLATEVAITARTHFTLADHSMHELLLRSAVEGREQILLRALRFDQTKGENIDTEDDDWAWANRETLSSWGERGQGNFGTVSGDEESEAFTFSNTAVELEAWVEDERSKLNVRGLVRPDDSPGHTMTKEALIRLIDVFREDTEDLDLSDSEAQEMVDDLVEWLHEAEDSEENPMPPLKPNRGRLLTADDLLRVPGGKWKSEILYDVRDPADYEDEDDGRRRRDDDADADAAGGGGSNFERRNGVPGLIHYITVFAEDVADPPLRINVNTAPLPVLRAMLDPQDDALAEAILAHRREGAGADEEEESAGTGEETSGFFKSKADLTKVDGLGDDLSKYPRLNFFADVQSSVFSLCVIARMVTVQGEAGEEDEDAPRDVVSTYQHRRVVQRTQGGFTTIFTERRSDPLFD